MANTFKFGNGEWAVGKETALAYNDENSNFKPLPFTFDRASSATVVNKQGLIETVGVDEPRIDFLNNTKGHLLLEPSRQNVVTYSEDYSQSEWTNSSYTKDALITFNSSSIAPDGSLGVYRYENTVSGSNSQLGALKSITSGVEYTTSFYIKRINGNGNVKIRDINNTELDITNDLTNDWKRFTITGTSNAAIGRVYLNVLNLGDIIEVWGAQLEQGSYATSYIPTQGETNGVTRSAENCSGAGNSTVFNDSEGVLYVETEQFVDGDFEHVYISLNQDGSSTNHLTIQHRDNGQLRVYANGFGTAEIQFLVDIDMAQNLKIAVQYKQNDYKLFVNGTQYSVYSGGGSQPAITGLNVVKFHLPTGVSQFWLGKVKDLRVYNTALTDAELIALTS